jgi:hypothetical protein
MLGRGGGKDSHVEAARSHQSAPLTSLKDPSTFAPPPKRLDYGASPTASRPRVEAQRAEEEANRPPPGPYRPDTTGLDTAHLPKPPAFRPGSASPAPSTTTASTPRLPPRLPPRQNEYPDEYAPAPPPTYNEATQGPLEGMLNQGALNRLGQAGVSVPGFGMGRSAPPPVPARRTDSPPIPPRQTSASGPAAPPAATGHGSQLGELQSRFGKMSTGTSSNTEPPAKGTSWADKQAALRTASGLRDDPSKVSGADMRSAASTASNFQQRHGAQVASGLKTANGLGQKYGLAGRVNNFASSSSTTPPPQSPTMSAQGGVGKKPAPPPPPPKKKELGGSSGEPPPIPLSSKPKF